MWTCRFRTRCRCYFIIALRTKTEVKECQHVQFETASTDDTEPTFGDVVPSEMTGRNGREAESEEPLPPSANHALQSQEARAYIALRQ